MISTCVSSIRDVRKFKETKKQFDKVREDMEIAQVKNAQAPRNKPHEVEEATGTLSITRKCFRHLALDYVLQVRTLWQPLFNKHRLNMSLCVLLQQNTHGTAAL